MGLLEINDGQLRRLVHAHHKVFTEFTAAGCVLCQALQLVLERLAAEPAYQNIVFARLDAGENPVARQLMNQQQAPFFISYCQGRLLHCDTLTSEAQIRQALETLRLFVPVSA